MAAGLTDHIWTFRELLTAKFEPIHNQSGSGWAPVPEHLKQFAFMERAPEDLDPQEPGLEAFLKEASLSGDATEEDITFLKRLKFKGKRPTPLYYYRELQNLRDPLHFHTP
jgi:hypothetical protein